MILPKAVLLDPAPYYFPAHVQRVYSFASWICITRIIPNSLAGLPGARKCSKTRGEVCKGVAPRPISVKPVAVNMRSEFELSSTGTCYQRRLWKLHSWRRSSCDWMHGGSPSSHKFPSNRPPILTPKFVPPCRIPPLCDCFYYYWSSIVFFTDHYTSKRYLIWFNEVLYIDDTIWTTQIAPNLVCCEGYSKSPFCLKNVFSARSKTTI